MAETLKTILDKILNKEEWKLKLLNNWPDIIGEKLSSKVRIEKITNNTLILGVFEASWLQELYLMSNMILITINSKLDKPYIKELRFKRASKKATYCPKNIKPEYKPQKNIKLNIKEESALTNIKDEELKKALHNFLIRCYREK